MIWDRIENARDMGQVIEDTEKNAKCVGHGPHDRRHGIWEKLHITKDIEMGQGTEDRKQDPSLTN